MAIQSGTLHAGPGDRPAFISAMARSLKVTQGPLPRLMLSCCAVLCAGGSMRSEDPTESPVTSGDSTLYARFSSFATTEGSSRRIYTDTPLCRTSCRAY